MYPTALTVHHVNDWFVQVDQAIEQKAYKRLYVACQVFVKNEQAFRIPAGDSIAFKELQLRGTDEEVSSECGFVSEIQFQDMTLISKMVDSQPVEALDIDPLENAIQFDKEMKSRGFCYNGRGKMRGKSRRLEAFYFSKQLHCRSATNTGDRGDLFVKTLDEANRNGKYKGLYLSMMIHSMSGFTVQEFELYGSHGSKLDLEPLDETASIIKAKVQSMHLIADLEMYHPDSFLIWNAIVHNKVMIKWRELNFTIINDVTYDALLHKQEQLFLEKRLQ